jgi:hypothetical protein
MPLSIVTWTDSDVAVPSGDAFAVVHVGTGPRSQLAVGKYGVLRPGEPGFGSTTATSSSPRFSVGKRLHLGGLEHLVW